MKEVPKKQEEEVGGGTIYDPTCPTPTYPGDPTQPGCPTGPGGVPVPIFDPGIV